MTERPFRARVESHNISDRVTSLEERQEGHELLCGERWGEAKRRLGRIEMQNWATVVAAGAGAIGVLVKLIFKV